jgi:hypothetical protein
MRIIPVRSLRFALAILLLILVMPAASFAQVSVLITVGPPALPVYDQPFCPGQDYIWVPGYWAYGDDDYYWVPGTWVLAPEPGLFWTPGYWAWSGDRFYFYDGYWGPHIGFYGGINYGYGYFGHGYEGGRWDGGHFYYNRSVNNVNVTEVHNVYNTTVINNTTTVNRISYNGGNGGINERPTPQEQAVAHERHVPPVPAQTQHVQAARAVPQLRASANHGKPAVAATPKPGAFTERGVVPAKLAGAPYNPAANHPAAGTNTAPRSLDSASRGGTAVHPNDLPAIAHPAPPNTGNPKIDQGYQQQQERLRATQEQERQKLQQKQEQDHERLLQQKADEVRTQQLEERHQQQTQQLEQRHANQERVMQNRQQPPPPPPQNQSKPPKEGRPPAEKP